MNVIVYSQDVCKACGDLKTFLNGNGIEYVEKNISHDSEAKEYVLNELNAMGTPVTEITISGETHVFHGFNPHTRQQIAQLLDL